MAEVRGLRDGNRTLSSLAAIAPGTATVTGRGEPQQILAYRVSGDFFTVLGVPPATGRLINAGDDVPNGGKVIALGYALWQRLYGGDPRAVGQSLTVDGEPYTVVSVMPASFGYPAGADAWVPLALPAKFQGNNFLRLIGRLKPGTSLSQAADDLHAISTAYNQANRLKRDVKVYLAARVSRGPQQAHAARHAGRGRVRAAHRLRERGEPAARAKRLARARAGRSAPPSAPGGFASSASSSPRACCCRSAGSVLGVLLASWLLRLFLALAPTNFAGVQTIRDRYAGADLHA